MINSLLDLVLFAAIGFGLVVAFDFGIGYIFDKIVTFKTKRRNI